MKKYSKFKMIDTTPGGGGGGGGGGGNISCKKSTRYDNCHAWE